MTKNKYYLIIGLLSLLITTAVVAGITSATEVNGDKPDCPNRFMGIKPDNWQERPQPMKEIFDNKNYQSWQDLMNQQVETMTDKLNKMKESINQETFDKMIQIQSLIQEGKYDEAKVLEQELGLNGLGFGGFGMKRVFGMRPGFGMKRSMDTR